MKFNEFMKKCRENASLTQESASETIGVGVSTIQNWERGSNKPDIAIINNISKAYSIPLRRILDALAKDLEILDDTDITDTVIPYTDLLPDNLNYSEITDLYFTKKEQDLFLIFALNITCLGNPIPEMMKLCIDPLELTLIIDKFKKLDLFRTYSSKLSSKEETYNRSVVGSIQTKAIDLTDKGDYVLNSIKKLDGELFSVYNLNFKDFLKILELYKIQANPFKIADTIKQLSYSNEIPLETYVENPEYRYYKNRPKEKKVDLEIKKTLQQIHKSYYTIIEEECSDDVYVFEKETHLKKLDFYEKHKDLNDGLIKPEPFFNKIIQKAIPTEKTKRFIETYEASNSK